MLPRDIFSEEHDIYRDSVARLIRDEFVPYHDKWEEENMVPHEAWLKAGEAGMLCCTVPEDYGGPGGDFLHSTVVTEELFRHSISGPAFMIHSDMVTPYLLDYGTEEQKRKWLPEMVTGRMRAAIGFSEPSAGSDLAAIRTAAVRDGDNYVLNGQKTFITGGYAAELLLVACKTDPSAGAKGISLIMVEADRPGYARGKKLNKIGLKAQDTAEIFMQDVCVPASNLIGVENRGFYQMMKELAQERLVQAVRAQIIIETAILWTIEYTVNRPIFGRTVADFQNTRFKLAEMHAQASVMRAYVDRCISAHTAGKLDATEAAIVKMTSVELQGKVLDECLQLHGGWGYIWDYPIARAYADARIARIAGGTVEVMKQIISNAILPSERRGRVD